MCTWRNGTATFVAGESLKLGGVSVKIVCRFDHLEIHPETVQDARYLVEVLGLVLPGALAVCFRVSTPRAPTDFPYVHVKAW